MEDKRISQSHCQKRLQVWEKEARMKYWDKMKLDRVWTHGFSFIDMWISIKIEDIFVCAFVWCVCVCVVCVCVSVYVCDINKTKVCIQTHSLLILGIVPYNNLDSQGRPQHSPFFLTLLFKGKSAQRTKVILRQACFTQGRISILTL